MATVGGRKVLKHVAVRGKEKSYTLRKSTLRWVFFLKIYEKEFRVRKMKILAVLLEKNKVWLIVLSLYIT